MPGPILPPFMLPQAVSITFAAGIFIGFYILSLAFANRWLLFTDDGWRFRSRRSINWYIHITTNAIAVLVMIGQALNVNTSIAEATLVEQGHKLSEYVEPPWKEIVKCTVSELIVLLADTVLMYRLWVTHSRRMAVMWLPIFLWLSGIVCTVLQLFLQVKNIHDPDFGPYNWAKVNMNVGPGIAITPFLASTVVLNAYCTGLLIWRIWKSLKHDEDSSTARQLQFLIRILTESGILYLSISIAHFVAYFGHNNFAVHMIGTLHTVVVGMAYNLVIIRVGQIRSEEEYNGSDGKLTTFQVAELNQEISFGSTNSMGSGSKATEIVARDKPVHV